MITFSNISLISGTMDNQCMGKAIFNAKRKENESQETRKELHI